ncbi:MAG: type II CRISPR RNA-guided endonuclease Cas9 [bacterium]|nr:type II CRISPR RNA-guided endonuclease Cas9 [Candidatus Limimorpha caballi]
MKKILGLDLGTNSIGWAVVNANIDNDGKENLIGIDAAGSRIIPMDAAVLGDFDNGNTKSQTADRTSFRGTRRLRERHLLRRERLNRVLDKMGFLPEHFSKCLDRYGKFVGDSEPKIAWRRDESGKMSFLFEDSFNEMLSDFMARWPELTSGGKKIPYDWTVYYLRKKALEKPITKEELAWILLNFNQKRGYYQLRGEEIEENPNKSVEYFALKVVDVVDSGEKKGKDTWYNVILENGWIYRRTSQTRLDWVGKTKEFIVTTDLNDDGTPKKDKDGNVKRSFRSPKEDDWTLLKTKTQHDIDSSGKSVGAFIYDALLSNPTQKIRGKLVRTIERKYYKQELRQILNKQKEFVAELKDSDLYRECIEELYPNNDAHRNNISNRDFTYLLLDDIIFYQRPLKSKKSLIDDCQYETTTWVNKETGEVSHFPIKCIAKSNPLFQEFRLWQFISNIRIYQKEKVVDGKLCADVDVTSDFIKDTEDIVSLFDFLNDKKEIEQKTFLKNPRFGLKKNVDNYRWNYVEDKKYPCNETRAQMLNFLDKCGVGHEFLTDENEMTLWHILYSVEDKAELSKALNGFAMKHNLKNEFVEVFEKFPPFPKDYGSYSAKAIKKLLPLMRIGRYWSADAIDEKTKDRIDKLINGEFDEKIKDRVREKSINLTEINHFQGLPLWLACYVVYDRHSEAKDVAKWEKPEDVDTFLHNFKQHSLRNPIVEQVILETLRVVRDIWKKQGHIDEIHVELGREMKNPADKRNEITRRIQDNENTNLRIKAMLAEFANPEYQIENVRPYSPMQQDILKIYEEYAVSNLKTDDPDFDFVSKISKTPQPSKSDIIRYRLWLEQKYRSPYTGEVIPFGKLFTPAYEIEHVIPQSRYFDDSLSNKVICESEVNKLKDKSLGYEFIKNHNGEKVKLGSGKTVEIFSEEAYEKFVKDHYSSKRGKMKKLLMDDIPDDFINRQLNDSRYISKVVKGLLSNIVREEGEDDAMSKNVIVCSGGITDRLKKDWGINDVWNAIILPRFQRLNRLTNTNNFTTFNSSGNEIPEMPLELQKGFNRKRIDHRHHAMDAIMIACASRNTVNYLNNESATKGAKISRYDLQHSLCFKSKTDSNGNYQWILKKPWETITQDTRNILENIIVSFKRNIRVINKTVNHYQHFENGKKVYAKQDKGDSWAIRKPMHKDIVFGEVNLQLVKQVALATAFKDPQSVKNKDLKKKLIELIANGYDIKKTREYFENNKDVWADIDLSKIDVFYYSKDTKDKYFATRFMSDLITYFAGVKDYDKAVEKINDVTDSGIRKILINHLKSKDNNPETAFSADGIDEMNANIVSLNDGKMHKPIYKIRRYEKADKFAVGQTGNKPKKFVEAAKGTNLFFAVYENEITDKNTGESKKVRSYATIPLNVVIDRQKKGLPSVPDDENGNQPIFVLSPNDLVYVPECSLSNLDGFDRTRLYKFVDSSDTTANFVPHSVSNLIYSVPKAMASVYCFGNELIQNEYGVGSPQSKNQRATTGEMIKEVCIPISIDRLGNIDLS